MASQFLKGITVEINGDTSGLTKSLKEVDSSLKDTQFELNATNKALKLDPSNTELVAQKQQLLKSAIQETSDKLKALNDVKDEFDSKGKLTEEQEKQYRELTRAIVNTESSLEGLKDQADGIAPSFDKASDSALTFGDVLKANVLGDVITSGINTMVSGLEKLATSLIDLTKSGIEYNATMEGYTTAFTAMLGSADEADKAINKIKENSRNSPFDISSLVQANQLLLTTGVSAEEAEKTINALGDAVAYTGGGNDVLKRMASNLQQIKNVGKASATDIRQFAMAGIDIYGVLSDYLGITTEQVKDLDITYQDLSNALVQASSEGGIYFEAQVRQSQTLNGQLSLVQSQWNELSGVIANDATSALTNDFLPAVNEALDGMINWQENGISTLSDAITQSISDMLMIVVERTPDLIQGGVDIISAVLEGLLTEDEKGQTALEKGIAKLVELLSKWVLDNWDKLLMIGVNIAKGIIEGLANALNDWIEENSIEGIDMSSLLGKIETPWSAGFGGTYGSLSSGGFASGGITLNTSFNISNTQMNDSTAKRFAKVMANEINKQLGGMV